MTEADKALLKIAKKNDWYVYNWKTFAVIVNSEQPFFVTQNELNKIKEYLLKTKKTNEITNIADILNIIKKGGKAHND